MSKPLAEQSIVAVASSALVNILLSLTDVAIDCLEHVGLR